MRIAVISDIHSNDRALERFLEEAERGGVDAIWSLGDMVGLGQGSEPERTVQLLRQHADLALLGNHDACAVGIDPPDWLGDRSSPARREIEYERRQLSDESVAWMKTLESFSESQGISLYHASAQQHRWDFVTSAAEARLTLHISSQPLVLVGHTHRPLACFPDGPLGMLEAKSPEQEVIYSLRQGGLLNPGSLGCFQFQGARAGYWLELDTRQQTAVWHEIKND